MSRKKPFLSLGIPTYNRPEALRSTLAQLESELQGLQGQVEVFISDNCSTYDISKVVSQFDQKFPITLSRNTSNIGFDANIVKLINSVQGKYVWLLGDDDCLLPGSLKRVLTELLSIKNCPSAVYVPVAGQFSPTSTQIIRMGAAHRPVIISFIGTICLHTNTAKEIINNQTQLSENILYKFGKDSLRFDYFAHTYIFSECASKSKSFVYLSSNSVIRQLDPRGMSYERRAVFYLICTQQGFDSKRYYSWIHTSHDTGSIRKLLVQFAIATERPDLRPIVLTEHNLSKKLESPWFCLISNILDSICVLPIINLVPWAIVKLYFLIKDARSGKKSIFNPPSRDHTLDKLISRTLRRNATCYGDNLDTYQ